MKPSIVIVGTEHRLQAGHAECSDDQHKGFRDLLDKICKKYGVKHIAAEMSEDLLIDFGTTGTNGKQVAKSLKDIRKNSYVDLSAQERAQFRIDRVSLNRTRTSAQLTAPQFAALERLAEELRECI